MVTISFSIKTKTVLTVKLLRTAGLNQDRAGQSENMVSRAEDRPALGALRFHQREPWGILGSVLGQRETAIVGVRILGIDILWRCSLWNLGCLTMVVPPAEDRQPGLWAQGGVRYQGYVTQLGSQPCALTPTGLSHLGLIHACAPFFTSSWPREF